MFHDFDDFLNSVKYLDKEDILETAYKRHKVLDKSTTSMTTENRLDLQNSIKDLLFWLEKNQRPAGLSDLNFAKFKPICENLIKKEQMETNAIDLFE